MNEPERHRQEKGRAMSDTQQNNESAAGSNTVASRCPEEENPSGRACESNASDPASSSINTYAPVTMAFMEAEDFWNGIARETDEERLRVESVRERLKAQGFLPPTTPLDPP